MKSRMGKKKKDNFQSVANLKFLLLLFFLVLICVRRRKLDLVSYKIALHALEMQSSPSL